MSDRAACATPLVEILRSVPKDYRTARAIQWAQDGTETGHQFIPVGNMMHEAADRIAELERELAAIRTAVMKDPLFELFTKQGFWHAHHVDLVWRVDGEYKRHEADWLKDVWYALKSKPDSAT